MYYTLACVFFIIDNVLKTFIDWRQYNVLKSGAISDHLKDLIKVDDIPSAEYVLTKMRYKLAIRLPVFFIGLLTIRWLPIQMWNLSVRILSSAGYDGYDLVHAYIYMLIGYIVSQLVGLLFNLYDTFIIEEKYGFNTVSLKQYFTDLVKSLLLIIVVLPIGCGTLSIIKWGGDYFYIHVSIFSLVLSFILTPIYQNIIAPWFNNYTVIDPNSKLGARLYSLASKVDFPLTEVYVVDTSTRSTHSNAYFYGFGRNKRIVLYDNLVNQMSIDEIEAVICHEMGHYKKSHVIYSMIMSEIVSIIFLISYGWVMQNNVIFSDFGLEHNILMGLTITSSLMNPINNLLELLSNIISRQFEYQADLFATELGFDMITPLIKLNNTEKAPPLYDSWYSMVHNSHPTLLERITAIQNYKKCV